MSCNISGNLMNAITRSISVKRQILFFSTALAFWLLYLLLAPRDAYVPQAEESGRSQALPGAGYNGRDPLLPLPPAPELPRSLVALGEKLFHDPRLSHDNTIACASCHDLGRGGTDRSRFSLGIGGQTGDVNAPTVFNVGLNIAQFWDGRAKTLEEQAAGPVHNPLEMGSNWQEVAAKLAADSEYPAQFGRAFPDGITAHNIAAAIAAFERTLLTPNARFDRYLRGDTGALSRDEQKGFRLFVNQGCASCHQGAGVGGNMFQRFGVMGDFFANRPPSKADLGRFNVTGLEEDRHVFKVPGLRNVALTAPYFHDGSAKTLSDAVAIMGQYQLGRALSKEEVRLIVAFLQTLNGEWRGEVLQ